MISKELMEFYEYCTAIEDSYSRSWLVDDPNWTTRKISNFSNGIILGLYKESDPLLLSLMEKQHDNDELYRLLCKAVDQTNAMGKKQFVDYGKNPESAPVYNYPRKKQNLVEWYKSYDLHMIESISQEDDDRILSFLYIYYAYEEYRTDINVRAEKEQPNIHEVYQDETDDDFCDWNLVPIIDAYRILKAYTPPRIFDRQKSLTLFVDLPKTFVEVLIELQACKVIGKLSVKCKDNGIFEGLQKCEVLCEYVEQGRVFTMDVISLPPMTKLYDSKEYHDQLWVKKTDTELTFEELCEDLTVEYDSIVTKMVHITYKDNTINHIDYEKIYYTLDEYENRSGKMNTKGTAYKRQKYFKINDSCIPFNFPCKVLQVDKNKDNEIQVPFIFFVLNCFFSNKNLINEYFENVVED